MTKTTMKKGEVDTSPHDTHDDAELRDTASLVQTLSPIARDLALSQIALILRQGQLQQLTYFPPHTGFMIQLRSAYTRGDATCFEQIICTYLSQAQTHLPHCPAYTEELHKALALRLQQEPASFEEVARFLLRGLSI